jgi:hypothetical protein
MQGLQPIADKLYVILIYEINGILYLLYWLSSHLPILGALSCASLVLLVYDRQAQELAYGQPGRWGRPGTAVETMSQRRMQLYTMLIFALHFVGMVIFPEPVPFLGLVMWAATVVALWMLPSEREPLLFRCKGFIVTYALILIGFKLYLSQVRGAPVGEWAQALGESAGTTAEILARNVGIFTFVGMFASWFAIPFAHVSYVVQRLLINPESLFFSRKGMETLIKAFREREME